jgi:type II secretion system protein N
MKVSPRKLKYLRWVGYAVGYVLLFAIFAYVSFPYERLRQFVVASYNAAQVGVAPNRLEIDSMSWSWRFPGIVAKGVRLVVSAPPAPEGEKQPPPQYLEADRVFVSASAVALMSGAREASFGADALGGQITGWASDSESARKLDLTLDGIEPGGIPQLASAIGLPLIGQLSGHISLELPERSIMKAEGSLELSAEDLVLGDGKAKIQNAIEFPPLHMGAFTLKAQVNAGRLKIDECTAQGRDVDLTLGGSVRLRPRIEGSLADLDLKFSFSDKYKTQSDLTKAIFGQPDSKVPGLFDTVTSSSLSKQEDGAYAARLTGPFNRIKPRPATAKRSGSSGASSSPTASPSVRRRASSRLNSRRAGARTPPAEEAASEETTEGSGEDVQ